MRKLRHRKVKCVVHIAYLEIGETGADSRVLTQDYLARRPVFKAFYGVCKVPPHPLPDGSLRSSSVAEALLSSLFKQSF